MTTGRASRAPAPAPTPGEVVALRPTERPPAGRLPVELTSFVGREREVAEVVAALAGARILTLTGAGGCGKTRLALRAAGAAGARRPDGAWCVELAPIADPGLVAPALATALGVRPLPGQDDLAAAVAALASRRALVLLDNCEHLAEEAAGVAEALARGCPGVTCSRPAASRSAPPARCAGASRP